MVRFKILILLLFFSFEVQAYERIISLKPNITELVYDLGLGSKLVGVTTYCDYPSQAQKIDKVADYVRIDVEAIVRKKPDIVLGAKENSLEKQIEFLRGQGHKVELYTFGTVAQIVSSIHSLGKTLEVEDKANNLAQKIEEAVKNYTQQAQALKIKPRLLVVVGHNPLVVVGGHNFMDELITLAGGINVVGASSLPYPTYSLEQFVAANPDMVVDLVMGTEKETSLEKFYQNFASVKAVRNKHVYKLNMDRFRASMRFLDGLGDLAELVSQFKKQ
ncbi:helical backbone metal receptor [bacterium]|nr:helical backbone metal receptor [bacterium]